MTEIYESSEAIRKTKKGGHIPVTRLELVISNKYAGSVASVPGGVRRRLIKEGHIPNPVTPKEWKIHEYYVPTIGSWFGMVPN